MPDGKGYKMKVSKATGTSTMGTTARDVEKAKRTGMMGIKKKRPTAKGKYGYRTKATMEAKKRAKIEAYDKQQANIATKKTQAQKSATANVRQ